MTDLHTKAGRIGPWSMFNLVFCVTLGFGLLLGPQLVIDVAREAAPLIMLVGVLLACALTVIAVWLAEQFPRQTIFEWCIGMFGPLGYAYSIGLIMYVVALVGVQAFQFSTLLKLLFLNRTPIVAIMMGSAVCAAYGTSLGVDVISRFFRLVIYLEVVLLTGLLVLGFRETNGVYLLPVLPTQPHVWLQGPYTVIGALMGFLYPPFVLRRYVDHRQSILWPCLLGVLFAGLLIVGFTVGVLGTFGADAHKHLAFSVFDFMAVVSLPRVLEFIMRYAPYFAIAWVLSVLKVGMVSLHVAATGLEQLLGRRQHGPWTPWLVAAVTLAAAFIPNAHVGHRLLSWIALAGVPITLVNTLVLAPVVLLMRRRARRVADARQGQ